MTRIAKWLIRCFLFVPVMMSLVCAPDASARTFKVLHSFSGGADGCYPSGGSLVLDQVGNLYGVTAGNACYGTVYEIPAKGAEYPLYQFLDGDEPLTVVMDKKGNLLGTTCCGGGAGGVIFEITSKHKEKLVHTFTGSPDDGCAPWGAMVADASGNFYGTTVSCGKYDYGTVYKLAPDNTESLVYSFRGGKDGYNPVAALTIDAQGTLYGTTQQGGKMEGACGGLTGGCGTVFRLTPNGTHTVLYEFKGPPNDGENAAGNVVTDSAGNIYSTTSWGGRSGCEANLGCGAVFKLTPDGTETILHFFKRRGRDGRNPFAGLIFDGVGNLYGTTEYGGGKNPCNGATGCGTVFEITPNGTETILHAFGNSSKGVNPSAGLVMDAKGHLFGTTAGGGYYGYGTVFEITP